MTVHSHVLAHGAHSFAAPGTQDIATVPVGQRWVIRDATFFITSAAAGAIFRVGNRFSGVTAQWVSEPVVTDETIEFFSRYCVLEAGATIRIAAVIAGLNLNFSVSGYKFDIV